MPKNKEKNSQINRFEAEIAELEELERLDNLEAEKAELEKVEQGKKEIDKTDTEKEKSKAEKSNNLSKAEREKIHKRRIKAGLIRVSMLAMLFVVSTYAWFTTQKDISLSNLRGTVEVVENMEISLDAKTWHQEINLADAVNVFSEAQNSRNQALGEVESADKSTALPIIPEQLLPVSSAGEKGGTLLPMYTGEATSTSLSKIAQCLEEGKNASNVDAPVDSGYFAFDIYIKNTSRDNENDVLQLNLNSAVQVITETIEKTITDEHGNRINREYVGNSDSGLQNTVRVALALYDGTQSSTATQKQILDATKSANIVDLAIWEPNAYDHIESIVVNNNKLINGSSDNKITFDEYDTENKVVTYAVNKDALTTGVIDNVYDITSTGLGFQNTFKTDNNKDGATGEVTDYRIYSEDLKPLNITNTAGNNFEIAANSVNRFRVYVWLEGQDVDCVNIASLGGGIELDLGLTKDNEVGDVLIDTRVSYNTVQPTTGNVTATITLEKEIAELPDGWTYANAEKTQISKVYSVNTSESVEIKDVDGKVTSVQIKIENIKTPVILVNAITGNEEIMYGKYTDYPIDIDGDATDNDWQIFYADGINVFLIADDYVLNSKLTNEEMTIHTSATKYSSYFGNSQLTTNTIEEAVVSKYMLTKAVNSGYSNYKATAHLLNTRVWNKYFTNTTYADSAVGGSTIEMFIESWNTKFNGNSNFSQLSYSWDATENKGYRVGTTSATDLAVSVTGYNNEMAKVYWPHTTYSNFDGTDEGLCDGYWLASPSGGYEGYVMQVSYDGRISYEYYNDDGDFYVGLRPVVCLKADIKAIELDEMWALLETN